MSTERNENHGHTHAHNILKRCLAAERLAADVPGCTRRQARTIIEACMEKCTLQEKWDAAERMEADGIGNEADQT